MTAAAGSFRLAWEHARAGIGRTALSILAVALGVSLVVALRLMNGDVLASFLDTVDALAGRAALTVTASEGITFEESLTDDVAAVPGVRLAVPLVRAWAFPDDGSGELLTVQGVDLTNDAQVRVYHDVEDPEAAIDDLMVFLAQPDSVIVGHAFAQRRGLGVGSPLRLVTPTGVRTFVVRGLVEPEGISRSLGGRLVIMDLPAAERAFTADRRINHIDVLLEADARIEDVLPRVTAVVPAGLRVAEPSMRRDVVRRTIAGFQTMLAAFGYLAVAAAFLICYGRLGAVFEARTWEIGLMRAVGTTRSVVFRELIKESLLLGLAGSALGVGLGVTIAAVGLPLIADATALNFRSPSIVVTPSFDLAAVWSGLAVGLAAAVAAATVPALRMARREPVAALTMRGREVPSSTHHRSTWVAISLLAITGAAAAWQQHTDAVGLGFLASLGLILASCALAPILVRVATPGLVRLGRVMAGPVGELACERLVEHPRRTAVTVATIGVGLGVILMFGSLGWSFERTLVHQMSNHLRADLIVHSALLVGGWQTAEVSEDLIAAIRKVPGVALAVGEHVRDVATASEPLLVNGYDAAGFFDDQFLRFPLEDGALPGARERVARGEAVLVTASLARQRHLAPGDTLTLPTPKGPVILPVAGVAPTEPMTAVLIAREHYRTTWHDPMITWVHVKLAPGAERATVANAIAQQFGGTYRVQVRTPAELVGVFADQVRQAFMALYVVEAIALLLVLVGIGDTLATAVIERTREIGTMRAIGLGRRHVFAQVVIEGLAMGTLGLVLASATGMLLGLYWVDVQFPAMLGWGLEWHLPLALAGGTALLTIGLVAAGAFLPALRATRLAPIVALRTE